MAAYNGGPYLQQSLESILQQTFRDFEFVIVDDASTDDTPSIIRSYPDKRIIAVTNNVNLGLTRSLNVGIRHCRGHYIARMDADDIALPERLERQVRYLDEHPDVGILGCSCRLIDARGKYLGVKSRAQDDVSIRWAVLLQNPFVHPSVMLRRSVLSEYNLLYDEQFEQTQDYEFFTRILKHTRGANLSGQLLLYRHHPGDITSTSREPQLRNHDLIALRTIQETLSGFVISREEVNGLRKLFVDGVELLSDADAAVLVNRYFDLCRAFTALHSGALSIDHIKRATARKAIIAAARCPGFTGLPAVLRKAYALHHGVVLDLLRLAPYAISRRLGRAGMRMA